LSEVNVKEHTLQTQESLAPQSNQKKQHTNSLTLAKCYP